MCELMRNQLQEHLGKGCSSQGPEPGTSLAGFRAPPGYLGRGGERQAGQMVWGLQAKERSLAFVLTVTGGSLKALRRAMT